jgi:hypothetical protein
LKKVDKAKMRGRDGLAGRHPDDVIFCLFFYEYALALLLVACLADWRCDSKGQLTSSKEQPAGVSFPIVIKANPLSIYSSQSCKGLRPIDEISHAAVAFQSIRDVFLHRQHDPFRSSGRPGPLRRRAITAPC